MSSDKSQPDESSSTPPKTILLVEDDPALSELLVQIIKEETIHQVFAATDGPQALEIVKTVRPHLFILDYGLPTMNGIELFDKLRLMEGLAEASTIMLSVNAPLHEIRQRPITYMKKPFDLYKLLEAIHNALR